MFTYDKRSKKYWCKEENLEFKGRKAFIEFIQKYFTNKKKICAVCEETFESENELSIHCASIHNFKYSFKIGQAFTEVDLQDNNRLTT